VIKDAGATTCRQIQLERLSRRDKTLFQELTDPGDKKKN